MPINNDLTTLDGCHAEIKRLRESNLWWVNQVEKQGHDVGGSWRRVNRLLLDEIGRLHALELTRTAYQRKM